MQPNCYTQFIVRIMMPVLMNATGLCEAIDNAAKLSRNLLDVCTEYIDIMGIHRFIKEYLAIYLQ